MRGNSSTVSRPFTATPFLRLLRREVEALVSGKHGDDCLSTQQVKAELARANRQLRQLRKQVDSLEARKAELLAELGS